MAPTLLCFTLLMLVGTLHAQSSDGIGCFVPGECAQSLFIDYSEAEGPQACLEFCQETPDCSKFTFFADTSGCIAYANCPELSMVCSDCISGDSTCPDLTTIAPSTTVTLWEDDLVTSCSDDAFATPSPDQGTYEYIQLKSPFGFRMTLVHQYNLCLQKN